MRDELSALERQVLSTLLAADHPVTVALRRQVDQCRVATRELTGHGFFSTLAVADDAVAAPVTRTRFALGDVVARIDGLRHGAGFVLFVKDGVLDLLEGFAYDEPWPETIATFEITAGGVTHVGAGETDLEQIEAAWDARG